MGQPASFLELNDVTPKSYVGQGGLYVRVNGGETGVTPSNAEFTSLSDVPASYVGKSRNILRVNSGETLLEYETRSFVQLTDAATIAVDASLGTRFKVTLGDNRMLGNPTNPASGMMMLIRVTQDGTGGRTLSYDTKYRFGTTVTTPVLSTAINADDYLGFVYNETDDKWDCIAFSDGY